MTNATQTEWETAVAAVLNKNRPPEKHLTGPDAASRLNTTIDELTIQGLYSAPATPPHGAAPGQWPHRRSTRPTSTPTTWTVVGRYLQPDPDTMRTRIAEDTTNGVTGIEATCGSGQLNPTDLPQALADLTNQTLAIRCHTDQLTAARTAQTLDHHTGPRFLGCDPISALLTTGQDLPASKLAELINDADDRTTVCTIDGATYHDAGSTATQQVGYVTATGIDTLRQLAALGIPTNTAWRHISFRYAIDADQFVNIAMLRAARILWAQVGKALGVVGGERQPLMLAVTSDRMAAVADPWVNMLRATVATFSASVGGAQAIAVTPFDAECGVPEGFSHRMARNTSHILALEGNIARVTDPAGGSMLVEDLTDQIAVKAWELVQRIEADGGMTTHVQVGHVEADMAVALNARVADISCRKRPLTGVSEFAPTAPMTLDRQERPEPIQLEDTLPTQRDSEIFEALVQIASQVNPGPLKVVTLGPLPAHSARLGFLKNLFGVAGLTAEDVPADDVLSGAASDTLQGAPVVFLAGNKAGYAEHGADIAAALRRLNAEHLVAAGKAAEWGDAAKNVDRFVAVGVDVIDIFMDVLRRYESATGNAFGTANVDDPDDAEGIA